MITKDEFFKGYQGNLEWLKRQTFFLTLFGSHLYGTNVSDSDIDVKGLCVAPKNYSTGFLNTFEQTGEKQFHPVDGGIMEIRKFIGLALENNPSVMEILWAPIEAWICNDWKLKDGIEKIAPFENLYLHRWEFLSQEAKHRYSGYAISQVRKLDLHRQYLLNPPKKKPEREDFDLPGHPVVPKEQRENWEALIKKQVEAWQLDLGAIDYAYRIDVLNKLASNLADMKLATEDQYYAASAKIGLDTEAMEYLKKERAFKTAVNEWAKYQAWQQNRNPKRASMEEKYGYDCKHAMHCIRLCRTAIEILEGKGVLVRRPDAEELIAIRNGLLSYEDFKQMVKDLDESATKALENTKLPKQGNRILADKICQEIVEIMW